MNELFIFLTTPVTSNLIEAIPFFSVREVRKKYFSLCHCYFTFIATAILNFFYYIFIILRLKKVLARDRNVSLLYIKHS